MLRHNERKQVATERQQPGRLAATVSVTGIPEALAAMRHEMAECLRSEAERVWRDGERNVVDSAVVKALERVADVFEAGLASASEVDG